MSNILEILDQPSFRLAPDEQTPWGRDEYNSAKYPIAVMSKVPVKEKQRVYKLPSIVDKAGRTIERSWTIGAGPAGLPITQDVPVLLALMQICWENGLESRKVEFSLYSLAQRLGLSGAGHDNTRLIASLTRFRGTTYEAKGVYVDAGPVEEEESDGHDEASKMKNFSLIDELTVERNRGRSTAPCTVLLSERLLDQMRAGGTKPIDLIALRKMSGGVGQSLFRYLDRVRLFGSPRHDIRLSLLAYGHLGMGDQYRPSEIKRRLDKAHDELLAMGFLRDCGYRTSRGGGTDTIVYYVFGEGQDKYQQLVDRMVAAGVSLKAARKLMAVAAQHVDERCQAIEAHLAELQAQQAEGRKIASPGGWLNRAISGDYDHTRAKAKRAPKAAPEQGLLVDLEEVQSTPKLPIAITEESCPDLYAEARAWFEGRGERYSPLDLEKQAEIMLRERRKAARVAKVASEADAVVQRVASARRIKSE